VEKVSLWTLYTSLQGRISKRTFLLWFFLPSAVALTLAGWIDMSQGYWVPQGSSGLPSDISDIGPWSVVGRVLTFWPGVACMVKRLHDLNMTGKHMAAICTLFALAITLFLFNRTGSDVVTPGLIAAIVTGILAIIYTLYVLILCCFKSGIKGPNSYGSDPLEE
jgi:uncharacterized membrane protein YhaH (DUF805 family)